MAQSMSDSEMQPILGAGEETVTQQSIVRQFAPAASVVGALGLLSMAAWGRSPSAATFDGLVLLDVACTANGQNCAESKCCSEPGMTCFKKNEHWASCNATCNEKMLWSNEKQHFEEQATKVWDCDELSAEPKCSKDGANCMDTECCTNPGSFCFKKNEHWASCNQTCNEKMLWNHDKKQFEEQTTKVWDCHKLSCTNNGENCLASQCCSEPGMTCFKKNEHWASCNQTCNEKMMWNHEKQQFEEQATKVWDCTVLTEGTDPDGNETDPDGNETDSQ